MTSFVIHEWVNDGPERRDRVWIAVKSLVTLWVHHREELCGYVEKKKSYLTKSFHTGLFMQNVRHLTSPHSKVGPKGSWEPPGGRHRAGGLILAPLALETPGAAVHKASGPLYTLQSHSTKSFPLCTGFPRKGTRLCRCYTCNMPATSTTIQNKLAPMPLQHTSPV